jgi:hypothetical protein
MYVTEKVNFLGKSDLVIGVLGARFCGNIFSGVPDVEGWVSLGDGRIHNHGNLSLQAGRSRVRDSMK